MGFQVYLKREDLLHGGAHKVNNTLGQGLLAKYMGKTKLIAETGAGQHGLATAMIGALLGMETKIFMGVTDIERQSVNVHKMKLCGAEVVPVDGGTGTLKDAINDALRYWTAHVTDTFYLFGTAAGPHPYPTIVKHFQSCIGKEARQQCLDQIGRLPDMVVACVGGGSNAIGIFAGFIDDKDVRLVGVEAGGKGLEHRQARRQSDGRPGRRPARGPDLRPAGRERPDHRDRIDQRGPGLPGRRTGALATSRTPAGPSTSRPTDEEVLDTFGLLTRIEGILPALESTHALA